MLSITLHTDIYKCICCLVYMIFPFYNLMEFVAFNIFDYNNYLNKATL